MVLPGGSLFDDQFPDNVVGIASSGQGKGIGEIGFGFTIVLIQTTGGRVLKTHAPPWGMGKSWGRIGVVLQDMQWDTGHGYPINPDQFA